ncbi:MAG: hypothetical protein EB020_12240 [Proteobacteria bacterium]|nr:hypothetical protein [Pseudomonadota bacterium]
MVEHAVQLARDRAWCMHCGVTLGGSMEPAEPPGRDAGSICQACLRAPAFDGFIRLGRYDSPLGTLVRRMKSGGWHRAARSLGFRLAVEAHRTLPRDCGAWCVTPIPGDLLRRLARGIDHTHALSHAVGRGLRSPLVSALALGFSSRQAGLNRRARLGRSRRMRLRRGVSDHLEGLNVLLVDDVRTTGATLREARELLKSAGAKRVVPAVVCVADRRKYLS